MKNVPPSGFLPACSRGIALSMALATVSTINASPEQPTGWIRADQTTVLADSVVNLEWSARYPKIVTEVVKPPVPPSGTVVTKTRVHVEVRVIGAAFGPSSAPYPVQGWVHRAVDGGWQQIFLGNQNTVDPQLIVWERDMEAGESLDFAFRGSYDRNYSLSNPSSIKSWQQTINTTSSSPRPYNRLVLKNGDVVPNFNPAFDQDDIHGHLKHYFEPGTKKLKLGPRDFIYLTELSPFNEGHKETDLQDLVLLVTFNEYVETVNIP